jgi:predicted aspartyl protease
MARQIKTPVRLWNYVDEGLAQRGIIKPEEIRTVELEEAVVDTASTRLVLTQELVRQLGLTLGRPVTVRYADHRTATKPVARGVVVEIMERTGTFDAFVEERGQPLIGIEILEALDLWPDPQRGVLTTNPESPDIPLFNLFGIKPCQFP